VKVIFQVRVVKRVLLFSTGFILTVTAAPSWPQAKAAVSAAKQEVPANPLKPMPPKQPIPFSHKLHTGQDISCESCHTGSAKEMTLPATSVCMGCHQSIATEKPSIQKLAEFARSKQPIPWVRVYNVRPGLRWSHDVHLKAGKTCVACHGDVASMVEMSEVTSVTTMYSCLNCHQKNQAKSECKTCHVWP
jgi:hypothetical protein